VADRLLPFLAGHIIAPAHALQLLLPAAVQGNDLGPGQYFDIVDRLDAVDEIFRHALHEAWPAHQNPDFCSEIAQEGGGLTRRVATSDQNDLLVPTQPRLDGRSPVPNTASLKIPEVRNIEAPVARAGRNHHAQSFHAPTIVQVKRERRSTRIKAYNFAGYYHPGAEFLRLDIGAAGERLAGNAGGKTEIILDTSARARLSAEGAGVEHDHRETLRCGVDRGRQASGSRPGDRDVIGLIPLVDRHHAECARQFGLVRVLQDRAFRTNGERQIRGIRGILLDQFRRVVILCRVEQLMRVCIAGQETLQANHIRTGFSANQGRAAGTGLEQGDATQNQCPHDPLAEFGLRNHQSAQIFGRNQQHFHLIDGVNVDQRRLAGQLPDFGNELAGSLLHDRGAMPQGIASHNAHRPLDQHEHTGSDFPRDE
jgi:hypothetical protein